MLQVVHEPFIFNLFLFDQWERRFAVLSIGSSEGGANVFTVNYFKCELIATLK